MRAFLDGRPEAKEFLVRLEAPIDYSVEKADELKRDISSLKKAAVAAEYLPPALRAAMGEPMSRSPCPL